MNYITTINGHMHGKSLELCYVFSGTLYEFGNFYKRKHPMLIWVMHLIMDKSTLVFRGCQIEEM